jgi:hypothetical protein
VPFSKIFPSSRSLNLLKKGLKSPGKVLEFHLQQRVNTLNFANAPNQSINNFIQSTYDNIEALVGDLEVNPI